MTSRTPPLTGETQPIIRIVEVLPAPFGPRNPNDSPGATSKSMRVDGDELAEALGQSAGMDERGRGLVRHEPGILHGRGSQRSGTVPVWMVTMPPDIPIQVTSWSPTSRMISAMRSGLG